MRPSIFCLAIICGLQAQIAMAQEPRFGRGAILSDPTDILPAAPPVTSSVTASRATALPTRVDLSGAFPPAQSQETQGSCVSWALVYGIGTAIQKLQQPNRGFDDLIRSPAYLHNSLVSPAGNLECRKGLTLLRAFNFLSNYGVPLWREQPYQADECRTTVTPAGPMLLFERPVIYFRNAAVAANDLKNIKVELSRNNPLAVVMFVDEFFAASAGVNKDSPIWRTNINARQRDAHAMVIVGYDDERVTFKDTPPGALKILNSHGSDFGENGYFYLPYAEVERIEQIGMVEKFKYKGQGTAGPAAASSPQLANGYFLDTRYDESSGQLLINIAGQLLNSKGRSAQLVAMFANEQGAFYKAGRHVKDDFVDQKDNVLVRSKKFSPNAQRFGLSTFGMSIPLSYISNELPKSGESEITLTVSVLPLIIVDGVEVGGVTPKATTFSILPSSVQ